MTRLVFGVFAALAALSAPAQAQINVETIVARHLEARGGAEALRAIRSLIFSEGRYSEPGYQGDGQAVMMLMRPYYKLVGHPERTPDMMEGYDGAAWEWYKDPGIVLRTVGSASAAIRHFADVEGPFLDYRGKGHKVELIGTEQIDGRPAYQVRLTMMDGYATDNFIDAQSYLIVATRHTAQVHAFGKAVRSQTRMEDDRRVAGVLFPFRSKEVEIATGKVLNAMQWGRIEANVDIPVRWFSPPEFERTRIQTLIEQLYTQRSDPQAMLWTYHHFRRAYPQQDTRVAAEVAGFQSLKMGAVDGAIALLERNAADHPDAADSAFGLGRAYAAAKRIPEARAQFQRALKLDPGHARATRALAELER